MAIPKQAINYAARKLYEKEARTSIPDGNFTPWDHVRPTTRQNYEQRVTTAIEAYTEWLRTGPGSGR